MNSKHVDQHTSLLRCSTARRGSHLDLDALMRLARHESLQHLHLCGCTGLTLPYVSALITRRTSGAPLVLCLHGCEGVGVEVEGQLRELAGLPGCTVQSVSVS